MDIFPQITDPIIIKTTCMYMLSLNILKAVYLYIYTKMLICTTVDSVPCSGCTAPSLKQINHVYKH